MAEQNFKVFQVEDKKMIFNTNVFKDIFKRVANKKEITLGQYEIELGEALSLSKDAIHGWRNGQYGPSDLELIELLAKELGTRKESLLKEKKTMEQIMNNKIDERFTQSVIGAYRSMLDYFEECNDRFGEYFGVDDEIEWALQIVEAPEDYIEGKSEEELEVELRKVIDSIVAECKIIDDKTDEIKKILKAHMLEIPESVYNKWNEQVDEVSGLISDFRWTIDKVHVAMDNSNIDTYLIEYLDECVMSCYDKFISYCRDEIKPLI